MPIQVGHLESPVVILPGHEAYLYPAPKNGIAYNFHPGYTNSFITNWTSTNAFPQWFVRVVRKGTYEITLLYTCKKENSGARLQVEIGDRSLDVTIDKPFDPEPMDIPFRLQAEAQKYLTKEWKTKYCGKLKLEKGDYSILVKTIKMINGQSIDLKAVKVKLL